MAKRRTLLHVLGWAALLVLPASGQMFYPDDPLEKEPPPLPVNDANYRELSDIYHVFFGTFAAKGELHPNDGVIPAQAVNTLGEVLDSGWYTNRHAKKRMTLEELKRGPGNSTPPQLDEPLQVLTVKRYDVRPGLLVSDASNELFLLRFDPPGRPEMATGASMIASRFYYAIGYNVAETYLIDIRRSQLVASPQGEDINAVGDAKKLIDEDIDLFLRNVPKNPQGGYRALAARLPDGEGLGPFQFYGTRSDDPNDVFPHEHRRDLRGLHVHSAWLGNNWMRPAATFDLLTQEDGVPMIRHHLTDFFASLGSGFQERKTTREGHEMWFEWGKSVKNFLGMGIYSPSWQRARYPRIRAVGLFEHEYFDPDHWMPNTHLAPFVNRLPDDEFWAAKIIMSFTDEEIRAIVSTAEHTDPRAAGWITECIIERRDKIGAVMFAKVLALDDIRVEEGELKFTDLEEKYGFHSPAVYNIVWSTFNNYTRDAVPIRGVEGSAIPEAVSGAGDDAYFRATIDAGEFGKSLHVYIRKEPSGLKVVGLDRRWPGKKTTTSQRKRKEGPNRYSALDPIQQKLFDSYTRQYNEKTGFNVTPEEYWRALSISERTTYDAATHALMNSELSDADGNSLGRAIDLLTGVERVAGHYYGREGDQQFRIYVLLRDDAQETVEKSQEFYRSHDNTVYHMGYPINYRQSGKVPTLQISMSEDGQRADIDVDYRSSKMPNAMWNGHLTAANSDVRAGDNYERHNNRWDGLAAWWKRVFGELPEEEAASHRILLARAPATALKPAPPNRTTAAEIPELADATSEFLHDWLVRHNPDEALEFISEEALPCISLGAETTDSKPNRETMRSILAETGNRLVGDTSSLSAVIKAVKPWNKNLREISHPFEEEYYLAEVADSVAESFRCEARLRERRRGEAPARPEAGAQMRFGTYYTTIFGLRYKEAEEGVLALLWKKEQGVWRLLAWDVINE